MKLTKEDIEMLQRGLTNISGALTMYLIHGCTVSDDVGKVYSVIKELIKEAEEQDND